MTNAPENFDWVSARSKCSIGEVFEILRQQVKQDVETRVALRKPGVESFFTFKVVEAGPFFSAIAEGHKIFKRVSFEWDAKSLRVQGDDGRPNLTATLTLSNDGVCRIKVDGQEYDLWQFRKMALEDLFFGEF